MTAVLAGLLLLSASIVGLGSARAEPITESNVWLCTIEGPFAPAPGCGTAVFTQVVELPDDADTCDDDDDGDGKGCAVKTMCLASDGGLYDPPCNESDGTTAVSASTDWDGSAFDLDLDGGEISEGLGAFEFGVQFDYTVLQHPTFDLTDTVLDDTGRRITCLPQVITAGWLIFGCATTANGDGDDRPGEPEDYPHAGPSVAEPSVLVRFVFDVQPDVLQRVRPTKRDLLRTELVHMRCAAFDVFGTPYSTLVETPGEMNCTGLTLTVRMLEGDVDLDCDVDLSDNQRIAFRYGAVFGSLGYDRIFDVEPTTADRDIDIGDLQFVFGRNASRCTAPVPAQDPLPHVPDP